MLWASGLLFVKWGQWFFADCCDDKKGKCQALRADPSREKGSTVLIPLPSLYFPLLFYYDLTMSSSPWYDRPGALPSISVWPLTEPSFMPRIKQVPTVDAAHRVFDRKSKLVTLPWGSMTNVIVLRTARLRFQTNPVMHVNDSLPY